MSTELTLEKKSAFRTDHPLLYEYPDVLRLIRDFDPVRPTSFFTSDLRQVAYNLSKIHLMNEVIEGKIDAEYVRQRPETDYEIARMENLRMKLAEPSSFARVRMRFQRHAVENPKDYENIRDNLATEMKAVYKKGETNILFLEQAVSFNDFDKKFSAAYKKYGSAMKAYASMIFPDSGKSGPQLMAVEMKAKTLVSEVKKIIAAGGGDLYKISLYNLANYEAVDTLLNEGFKIKFAYEEYEKFKGSPDEIVKYMEVTREKQLTTDRARNRKIVQDILDIIKDADSTRSNTNILLTMGSFHIFLVDLLTENLRPITEHSIDERDIEKVAEMRFLQAQLYE